MIKRILALITILCLVCTSVAFAEDRSLEELYEMYMNDVIDINRVYKYDLAAKKSAEESKEIIVNKNAVNTVLALKLMSPTGDGTFNEAGAVPLRDFAKIIMTLAAGSATAFENNYDDYPETRFTTQDEAAYYLVGVLGYEAYAAKYNGDNARSMVARDIDLLDGIDFSGSKNITRGELARMLYNALTTNIAQQSTFGETVKYEITEGNTLVYNSYNAVIVRGIVTSQYGLSIDTSVALEDNTLAIDGAKFYLDNTYAPDLLGHKACALAKIDDAGRYRLMFIDYDEDDQTVSFNTSDITNIKNGTVYYDDNGKSKSVRINRISKIVVNGSRLSTSDLEAVLSSIEGEVRICPENDTIGSFAYISRMDTYKVYGISAEVSERIFLDHGAKYKNNPHIDFANKKLHVIKNGTEINVADIKTGSVISVIENAEETELRIIVSTEMITGTVEEIDGDVYTIGGQRFKVAECYESFRATDSTLPEIVLGTSGDFYLDYTGKIVSLDSTGGGYRLGYLKGIGSDGGVLGGTSKARIYNTDNEWVEYELADKITLDGGEGVSAKNAVATIQAPAIDGTIMTNNLIRYKLSGDGKIKLIDTAYVADEEQDDLDTIRHHGDQFVESFNWTASSKGYKSIGKYVATSASKVFNIPANVDDEEEYSFENSPTFSEGTSADLKMYNVSPFMVPDIIIRVKGSAASVSTLNHKILVVTRKMTGLNSDGDAVSMIECFDGSTTPTWKLRKFTVIESLSAEAEKLVPGDVLLYEATKDELTAYKYAVKASEWDKDIEVVAGGSYTMGMGEVLAVDPVRNHVRMKTGNTELTIYIHSLGMYSSEDGKTYNLSSGEIEVGDRMAICGGYGYMRCLVLR